MEECSSASNLRIQSEGFQNWMKCVCAQNETRKALFDVVEVKWKCYLLQMTDKERDQIETFLECLKYAKIDNLKRVKNQAVLVCGHSLCGSLLQKLLQLCDNELQLKVDESCGLPFSDSCYQQYWDIAKLYCAEDDSVTKVGLQELDISALSRMMSSCQLFAFSGSDEIYNTICKDRDELFHSEDNRITEERKGDMLKNVSKLLSNFRGFRLCEDVISDIKQIEAKDWLSEYQYEYKQIARQNLEYKLDAIKLDMSLHDDETLQELLNSSENLLQKVNESISADESKEERESQKEAIKSDRKDFMEENKRLKESVAQLEKESCQARIQFAALHSAHYHGFNISPKRSTSSKIQVTCLGTFQDVLIQIDGISILFDPLETNLLEYYKPFNFFGNIVINNRAALYRSGLDAVVLSTCLYSFTATTVREIIVKSPGVKWLTPTERKDWLTSIGVNETSIIEFDEWEEKPLYFGHTEITFACIKTNINSTSLHQKKCNTCGWVIKGSERTFYSSGITNYHEEGFKVVAKRFSPIHMALLPLPYCNMSCLAEFEVTFNEVIQMHVDVGSLQSLGIGQKMYFAKCQGMPSLRLWNPFNHENQKGILELEMKKLKLDPSTFSYLTPGETYKSK